MKCALLLLVLLLCNRMLHAQQQEQQVIDSLMQVLKTATSDTARVKAHLVISRELLKSGEYDGVMEHTRQALDLSKKAGFKAGIAGAMYQRGNMFYYQSNYPEALRHFLAALSAYEEAGEKKYVANSYMSIGNVYYNQKHHDEALKNYEIALQLKKQLNDREGIAYVYGNLSNVYYNMGRYAKSLEYQYASLEMSRELGSETGMAGAHNNIGFTLLLQGQYDSALTHLFTAKALYEKIGNGQALANVYNNIGDALVKKHSFAQGEMWLGKALTMARENESVEDMAAAYESLAYADSASGDYPSAYKHYRKYVAYNDSLSNEQNTRKIVEQQLQFEFAKKQVADSIKHAEADKLEDLKLQKQRSLTYAGLIGVVALLFFVGFIIKTNRLLAKEKNKSERLLLNILPTEVADELKNTGKAAAKTHNDVTVLFTDFISFTTLSEHLTAEQIVTELDRCFKAFDEVVVKYGMEKIKTIGDAYMAASGLPVANANHAVNAVQAAIEINEFITAHAPLINGHKLQMRIGIHSGPVVAGIVGVKKFAYDIWGDTVNTASRLESQSEAGKINISGATYKLVRDMFNCTYRGKILAKNKGEIDMYFVEPEVSLFEAAQKNKEHLLNF